MPTRAPVPRRSSEDVDVLALHAGAPQAHSGQSPGKVRSRAALASIGSLRKRLLASYGFPGDFTERDPPTVPRRWIDARTDPARALTIGTPSLLPRVETPMDFPVFQLPELSYFIGESEAVRLANELVRLWASDREADAEAVVERIKVLSETMPLSHPETAFLRSLRAYFMLDKVVIRGADAGLKGADAGLKSADAGLKSADAGLKSSDSSSAYAILRPAFTDSLLQGDLSTFVPRMDTRTDPTLSARLAAHPVFFVKGRPVAGERPRRALRPRPMTPVAWTRTTALTTLWNAAVLNGSERNWQRMFEVAERFEAVADVLGPGYADAAQAAFLEPEHAHLTAPVRVWPRALADLRACLELIKAVGFKQARDPYEMLRAADEAIRRARSFDVRSLAFLVAGHVYFDLNNVREALNAYAASELLSDSLHALSPQALFWGGESAYFRGEFPRARKAYTQFLEHVGDRTYGPWARMRLAEMAHVEGDADAAFLAYAAILRLHPDHLVASDAHVRLFCRDAPSLKGRARVHAAEAMRARVERARAGMKELGDACLLRAELADLAAASSPEDKDAQAEAQKQLDALKRFEETYPRSAFLPLFARRADVLKTAKASVYVDSMDCGALMSFYKENGSRLEALGTGAGAIVKGLRWNDASRARLVRCTALKNDAALWSQLRGKGLAREERALQDALYSFLNAKKPAEDVRAVKLLGALGAQDGGPARWRALAARAEAEGDALVGAADFWRALGASHLLRYDLSAPRARKKAFLKRIVSLAFLDPARALADPQTCLWLVSEKAELDGAKWDSLLRARPTEAWLASLGAPEQDGGPSDRCIVAVARLLLARAQGEPTDLRDKLLLRPYLEAKGIKGAPDEWLAYAQRLEKRASLADPKRKAEVRELYRRLRDEPEDAIIRQTARTWLERNGS